MIVFELINCQALSAKPLRKGDQWSTIFDTGRRKSRLHATHGAGAGGPGSAGMTRPEGISGIPAPPEGGGCQDGDLGTFGPGDEGPTGKGWSGPARETGWEAAWIQPWRRKRRRYFCAIRTRRR
jgi:hypothetical protein